MGQTTTMKNTIISPNFLVWKFCGKILDSNHRSLDSLTVLYKNNYKKCFSFPKSYTPVSIRPLNFVFHCHCPNELKLNTVY